MASVLEDWHRRIHGEFTEINGRPTVRRYGAEPAQCAAELHALRFGAGMVDLSCRSRLALVGADRVKFLHGQVTNDVSGLETGRGCYAAIVSAKGRIQSDAAIYRLADELLLDLEPGLADTITKRLEAYIISDDAEIVDVSDSFGMFSIQGPQSENLLAAMDFKLKVPENPFQIITAAHPDLGEIYIANRPRLNSSGFDLFASSDTMPALGDCLLAAAASNRDAIPCGWEALEISRIEKGIPRFGPDFDDRNFPQETGLEEQLLSYRKGCYIGQEIIARIRTYGKVTKHLRGFRLQVTDGSVPEIEPETKLYHDGKAVGYLTSMVNSERLNARVALGYARREVNQTGTKFQVGAKTESPVTAEIVPTPFEPFPPG